MNKMSSNTNNPRIKRFIPDETLKILILLHGFNMKIQQQANTKNNNPFVEEYNLINSEWINKFKEYYKYEEISNILKEKNFPCSKYEDFERNIDSIVQHIKKFKIYSSGIILPEELKSEIPFRPKLLSINDILY